MILWDFIKFLKKRSIMFGIFATFAIWSGLTKIYRHIRRKDG